MYNNSSVDTRKRHLLADNNSRFTKRRKTTSNHFTRIERSSEATSSKHPIERQYQIGHGWQLCQGSKIVLYLNGQPVATDFTNLTQGEDTEIKTLLDHQPIIKSRPLQGRLVIEPAGKVYRPRKQIINVIDHSPYSTKVQPENNTHHWSTITGSTVSPIRMVTNLARETTNPLVFAPIKGSDGTDIPSLDQVASFAYQNGDTINVWTYVRCSVPRAVSKIKRSSTYNAKLKLFLKVTNGIDVVYWPQEEDFIIATKAAAPKTPQLPSCDVKTEPNVTSDPIYYGSPTNIEPRHEDIQIFSEERAQFDIEWADMKLPLHGWQQPLDLPNYNPEPFDNFANELDPLSTPLSPSTEFLKSKGMSDAEVNVVLRGLRLVQAKNVDINLLQTILNEESTDIDNNNAYFTDNVHIQNFDFL